MTYRLRSAALLAATTLLTGGAVALAPAAGADVVLQVANVAERTDSSGTTYIYGEVVNTGTEPTGAQVDLVLRDSGGQIIGSEIGDMLVDVLGPGEKAPFEAQTTQAYASIEASPAAMPTTTPFNHAFTLTKRSEFADPSGVRQIHGDVRNDNTVPAEGVTVVFTFYDAAGKVTWAESVGAGDGGPVAAGATAPFVEMLDSTVSYSTWTAVAQATSAPSGAGTGGGPIAGDKDAPATTLNCNPTMTLSQKIVNVGRTTTVTVAGATPGSLLTLEGYSRPSTDYAPIRKEVRVASDGTVLPIAVRPPTSARVRLQISGCSTPGTGQVISVIPGLGITITRVGPLRYTFSGAIIPGKQNTGRAISLYVGSGTAAPVKKAVARSFADGRYSATLTLTRGAKRVYWATGADMTNLAGKSAVKAFTAS